MPDVTQTLEIILNFLQASETQELGCNGPSSPPLAKIMPAKDAGATEHETCACGRCEYRRPTEQKLKRAEVKKLRITPARLEALQLIADGYKHKAAAAKLGISESAFRLRLVSARENLDSTSTTCAIVKLMRLGLLQGLLH